MIEKRNPIIAALDVNSREKAAGLARELKGGVGLFKIGLELYCSCGPSIVGEIGKAGCGIFLDLKLHDIPTTVAKAAAAVTGLGISMLNVHALGGFEMMEKAAKAVEARAGELKIDKPALLAVTVLTSMSDGALRKVGIGRAPKEEAAILACLARDAGLDGVVASPEEIKTIREKTGDDFLIVTPGVRPSWAGRDDQERVATPKQALDDGADYIVIGRPITAADDPAAACKKILEEAGR